MLTQAIVTLVVVGAALLIGAILGATLHISRRDDLRNELMEARRELADLKSPPAPEVIALPEPELEDIAS